MKAQSIDGDTNTRTDKDKDDLVHCLREYIAKLDATRPAIHPTEQSVSTELAQKGADAHNAVRTRACGPRGASKRPRDL